MAKQKFKDRVVTDAWGIDNGYEDAMHQWRWTPPETRSAILAAMGGADHVQPPAGRTILIDRREANPAALDVGPGELTLEDGTALAIEDRLPADVPLGYHRYRQRTGESSSLVLVSPGACFLPDNFRAWGWAVQLYAARSRESWGIGDLADLRRLNRWAAELGAGLTLVNPLCAAAPTTPREASPYYPSSRRFRDPLYLRIEDVPGARQAGMELAHLAEAGRALNANRLIDRDQVQRLKMAALEQLWSCFADDPAFDEFCRQQGPDLELFATFCVLAEKHGRDYRAWPAELRISHGAQVAAAAAENADRVRFHKWLQWLFERQLTAATPVLSIVSDLPVGVDPGGADAWIWQDYFAPRMSVGVPPDVYNTLGQNWGLPPFIPHKLREGDYEPFIQTIRSSLRHAAGLRIDHVLGLFRLFWIPYDVGAAAGTFVRYPTQDLLAILAIESHRAGAFIVGEDLGTVEDVVQEKLAHSRLLSYKVLWFEDSPPAGYPELALAAVTTHDLPTIAGLWSGADLAAQHSVGASPNESAAHALKVLLQALTRAPADATAAEVVERTHDKLSEAPCAVIAPTLDDALAVEERPNMPGVMPDRWPNWSLALPAPLEEIEQAALPRAIARALGRTKGPPLAGRADNRENTNSRENERG